jgi:hypothetical protein
VNGELRVSDAEREQVVDRLRAAAGEGRLQVEELEQRIDAAYAARTRGDLATLERDLPARGPRAREREDFRHHLSVFLAVNAGLIVIWALTGMGYFWPVWPMLGWGIGVLAHAGCGGKAGACSRSPSRGPSEPSSA